MMNPMKMTALALGLSLAGNALTCTIDGKGGFAPENDLFIPVSKNKDANMTEAQFNEGIDRVVRVYEPIIANMGAKLRVERKWSDGTVNAYASQSGSTWTISMFGGLARHPATTLDGFSLVVCHEIGHHIGGAPKKGGNGGGGGSWGGGASVTSWASNEGQADYWGALKCLRKAFLNDNNKAIVAQMQVPALVTEQCRRSTRGNAEDQALCVRISMAGQSLASLLAAISNQGAPKFETPDSTVVSATNHNHPRAQCRLDTYFQGSLCDVSMNEDVSQRDEVKGTCHPSLGHKSGLRPLCWFKPQSR